MKILDKLGNKHTDRMTSCYYNIRIGLIHRDELRLKMLKESVNKKNFLKHNAKIEFVYSANI